MRKQSNKLLFALFLGFALGSLLFAHHAHAAAPTFVESISIKAVNFVVSWLFYMIGMVAAMVFSFGGFLIDLALELNSKVATLEIVKSGWTIVLNLTNLAFVLGIIWIAIATIVRSQSYGMKQILWKLIVAAVLVNFSLVIAGFFLDFAGITTQFFIDKASPAGDVTHIKSFATQLAASMQPQGLLLTGASSTSDFQKKLDFSPTQETTGIQATQGAVDASVNSLNILISLIFSVIFTVIGAIVFLGIAVMLLVRFLFIAILLILAPVVWLGWVFPALSKYWGEWWDNFLKWTFFAPITSFFLYLAILTALGKHEFIDKATQIASVANGPGAVVKAALFNSLGNAAQELIVIALMVGGLLAAERSGIAFAGAFKGMAVGVGKWTTDKAKYLGARAALRPLRGQWGKNFVDFAGKNRLARIAGLGLIARPMMGIQQRERAEIEGKIKEREKMSKENRNLRYALDMTSSGKAANMMIDARKGDFAGTDMGLARQNGFDKEMEKLNPALAEKVLANAEKVRTAAKPEEKERAVGSFKKELEQKLDSIKSGDQKDIKLEALLKGAGTGIKEEDWKTSGLEEATIDVIVRNVQADGFSRMTRELSNEKRREVVDKIIGMKKEDLDKEDSDEIRNKKLEEFKGRNESLYKYMKSVGNEIFMGIKTEEPGAEKPAEPAPNPGGEKK